MPVHLKILVFLVGTTITTSHVVNKTPSELWNPGANLIFNSPKLSYLPSPPVKPTDLSTGLTSLSSHFWPLNTKVFYNPRIIMNPHGPPFSTEIRQKDCGKHKELIKFSTDKTLETIEIKPVPERTQELPVPIMVEELSQHSPIMEIIKQKEPLVIPQAPELPPLHMPEIPESSLMKVAPLSGSKVPTIPFIAEFKPIDMPRAPKLPLFVMPEMPFFEEVHPLPEISPIIVTALPQVPPFIESEVSKHIEIQEEPINESVHSAPFRPKDAEREPLNIPTAPELPPVVLPELPTPVHIEMTPSHSFAETKLPEEIKIISEFRLFDPPSSPGLIPLNLPELPFISSYLPVKSPERKESEMNPECKHIQIAAAPELNIPTAPELPPVVLPELPAPVHIEMIPSYSVAEPKLPEEVEIISEFRPFDAPSSPEFIPLNLPEPPFIPSYSPVKSPENKESEINPEYQQIQVVAAPELNIPTAPELPPVVLPELPAPVHIEMIPSYSVAEPKLPEEVEIISEFRPFDAPSSPEFIPLNLPEPPFISSFSPVKSPEHKESEINPEYQQIQIAAAPELNIPTAPELPPVVLPELPAPVHTEMIPSYSVAEPKLPEEVEIISEFRPFDAPSSPEFIPLNLPEPPFISSFSPVKSPEHKESEINPESQQIQIAAAPELNIPTAPELPPVVLPELPAPVHIEMIPSYSVAEPKLLEEVEIISEFRPFDAPSSPEFIPLNLPEPPFISSFSPVKSPEHKESEINPESQQIQIAAAPELNIPTAPELPPVVLPELPVPVHIEMIPSHSCTEPKLPEEVEIISEFRPFDAPSSPGFIPLNLPEPPFISAYSPVKYPERKESEINPEFQQIQIAAAPELNNPTAPELLPVVLPEVPTPVHIELIPSHSIAEPKLPEEVEIISEFRPFDAPSSSGFLPLNLPEPPFIPSYSLVKSPESIEPVKASIPELTPCSKPDFSKIVVVEPASESQPLRVNILAAPELPPLSVPELLSPIEFTPNQSEDTQGKDFPIVNIPAAPILPPLSITEQPDPIKILAEISTPEIKPLKIHTLPTLPPLAIESISVENDVPESSVEVTKPLLIPQPPELPSLKISKLPPIAPEAPLIEEKPELVIENNPLPNLPEFPPFKVHKTEPIIVNVPATSNSEEPCKKDEERLRPEFISQALQRPMMYPVFLAQNIIIERVVPNLYLSHKPYKPMDRPDFAGSASHPDFSHDNVESEMYNLVSY